MDRMLSLEVSGMICDHSRAAVAQALKEVGEIGLATVDLETGRAIIIPAAGADPARVAALALAAIAGLGYRARLAQTV